MTRIRAPLQWEHKGATRSGGFDMAAGIRNRTGHRPVPRPAGQAVVRSAVPLVAAAVGIASLMWILGSLLVNSSAQSFLSRLDMQTTTWAVEHRTPNLDMASHIGTMLADTFVALGVTVVAVVLLRLWLGRWRESVVVVVALVGELLIFLVITAVVHRSRPAVPQLDQAPPTSSFPSGHTGAAIALYCCLAVILLRHAEPGMGGCQRGGAGLHHPGHRRLLAGLSRHALSDRRAGRCARQRHLACSRAGGCPTDPTNGPIRPEGRVHRWIRWIGSPG